MSQYYRLLSKQENAEPLFPKKFKEVAEAFLAEQCFRNRVVDGDRKGLSDGRLHYQHNVVRRWFIPYFGDWYIDRITKAKVDKFWKWRIDYWTTEEGKAEQRKRRKAVAVQPSSTTLNEEKISLKQVFNFAVEEGWLGRNAMPVVRLPIKVTPVSREPFSEDEWKKLYGYIISEWLFTAPTEEKLRARRRVQARVIATMKTGMRPPEASNLRWRDVGEYVEPGTTDRYAQLFVRGKNKYRDLIADEDVLKYLESWKKTSLHTKKYDYVFSNDKGESAKYDNRIFVKVLAKLGLLKNKHGNNRTLYSLRHTYATMRILDGDVDYHLLSKNMDTSLRMIDAHYGHLEPKQKAAQLTRSKRMEEVQRRYLEERKAKEQTEKGILHTATVA